VSEAGLVNYISADTDSKSKIYVT